MPPESKKIILASASPYKKALLERLALPFTSINPDIDEQIGEREKPADAAQRLAREKARKVASTLDEGQTLVIGCDQLACLNINNKPLILGKPGSRENAITQLRQSSGRTLNFFTAFHVLNNTTQASRSGLDETRVTYRELSDKEIEAYLDRENALDCAGSAKVEGLGISLLSRVESLDPTALIGLPLITLNLALRELLEL